MQDTKTDNPEYQTQVLNKSCYQASEYFENPEVKYFIKRELARIDKSQTIKNEEAWNYQTDIVL